MDIHTNHTVYVRALSNGEFFGGWAPVQARLEWLRPDGQYALFTLTEPDLDEEDEYEYYQTDTLLLAALEDGLWRVRVGGGA